MFGYGIGLSFMKKVVEAHQGRVSVESQENKGSIFTLTFPITGN
jgi:signal transduction histidine kinase